MELRGTRHDIFTMVRQKSSENMDFPTMYLWCGTDDSLINANREFKKLLDELNVEHKYEESEGNHSWQWWDMHITDALDYILNRV